MQKVDEKRPEVSQAELVKVTADFLEMGHVDNIIAMFKQDASMYALSGVLVEDERFMVRMGMAVLFEELVRTEKDDLLNLAVPSLESLYSHLTSYVRGEAANLLATINTPEALGALQKFKDDPDPQVLEIVSDAFAS